MSTVGVSIANKVYSGGITTFDATIPAASNIIVDFDAPIENLKIIPPSYV